MNQTEPLEEDGLYPVANGKVVSVVTYLEMRKRPAARPPPPQDDLALRHVARPPLDWYRSLYRRVGGDLLWFSRLTMSDEALAEILHDSEVDVHVLSRRGVDEGLLELDRRAMPDIELAFFGLGSNLVGRGAGRWLMERAIALAFEHPVERFHVHTCTLDHAAALPFYMRSGFVPYRRAVEIASDPRVNGVLPADSSPHHPVLG